MAQDFSEIGRKTKQLKNRRAKAENRRAKEGRGRFGSRERGVVARAVDAPSRLSAVPDTAEIATGFT
jgi:hypothetical protein